MGIHFDERDVLPLHMCFICEQVPQAIKVEVVAATPIDMLEEGYYDNGNSVHHFACLEGNLEILKMLKIGGDMAFKRKNYDRKSALDLATDGKHTECADWVQAFFDQVKGDVAEEKRLKDLRIFNAAAKLQSLHRGGTGRRYFRKVRVETDNANEAARIAADEAEARAEDLKNNNAATQIQKILRIKLAASATQRYRETRDEKNRQDCLEIEAKAFAEAQAVCKLPLVEYYTGLVLESAALSQQQEHATEALRLCLDERMGRYGAVTPGHNAGVHWQKWSAGVTMMGSTGPLINFNKRMMIEEGEILDKDHGEAEYPEIYEADHMLAEIVRTMMTNLGLELAGCTAHFVATLLDVLQLAEELMPLLEQQLGVEGASVMDMRRAQLEMDKVDTLMKHVLAIQQADADRDGLVQVEIDINKVMNNQLKKNNLPAVAKLEAVLAKMAFLQQCAWEERALQDDSTRKQHQLDYYKEKELCETRAIALCENMDKKGLSDMAEEVHKKMQHLTDTNWINFTKQSAAGYEPEEGEKDEDPLNPLGPQQAALLAAGGVDVKSLKGMADLTSKSASAATHKATWMQMEEEKVVWRSIRQMMIERYDLIAKIEELALHVRAEAIGVLKKETAVCQDAYEVMLTDGSEQATDPEEAMSEANAHVEAAAMKQVLGDVGAVLSNSPQHFVEGSMSGTLARAIGLIDTTARNLREEEANGTGDEEKEVDLADIGEMEQLAKLLKKAIDEIYKTEQNALALNS